MNLWIFQKPGDRIFHDQSNIVIINIRCYDIPGCSGSIL